MGPFASPNKSKPPQQQHLGLDAKAEYMDMDGVMRRSEKVTQRMIQRGLSIRKAHGLSDDDQLSTSYDERIKENDARAAMLAQEQKAQTEKEKANAMLKVATKAERRKWIEESNELIATRLEYWYTAEFVPHTDENVDVTEKNTPNSPSKLQRFIDDKGNLRRKSVAKADWTGGGDPAPTTTTTNIPHQEIPVGYVQVVTPPTTPA